MHPYVLVSLLSTVAAGVLGSAIWARDPTVRDNRLAALLLFSAALWSLFDVLSGSTESRFAALAFARCSHFGSLMIAPLGFHLLLALDSKLARRYGRHLRFAYASALLVSIGAVTTSAMTADVVRTSWGWAEVAGDGAAIAWLLVVPFPLAALADWVCMGDHRANEIWSGKRWIGLALGIPTGIAALTTLALPLLGIHARRLGAAGLVAWGAIALWTAYRFRNPILAPNVFAREILRTLPDGVVLLRLDDRVRAANKKMGELLGAPVREILGRPIGEILVDRPPGAPVALDERECQLVRGTGECIPVSVDGATLRDKTGDALGRVLVVRDLRELVWLRGRLVTSGRLVAVGQLAAGIAHEINNPIAYVQSNLNLFRDHWTLVRAELEKSAHASAIERILADGHEMIEESGEGLFRVAAIVHDVGGFSRSGQTERGEADIGKLLDTAVRVASPQLGHRIHIERRYAQLPLARCVPQELLQVFLNLLLNAAQSMDQQGTIRLTTELLHDRVQIRVSDHGGGIEPATLEQIFVPFFTTKAVGEGMGLGLSISRQIVEKHGGTIRAESRVGEGTTFQIDLPVSGGDGSAGAGDRY